MFQDCSNAIISTERGLPAESFASGAVCRGTAFDGTGFDIARFDIAAEKKAKAEKAAASRAEVVGLVPSDDPLSERFVNQVVKAVGLLGSPGITRLTN